MDVSALVRSLQDNVGSTLPGILGALVILVVGWLVAVVLRAAVRKGLGLIRINARLQSVTGNKVDVEGGVAVGVYYLVLVLALIAFFNALRLELVSAPLQGFVEQVLAFLPNLIAAGVLLLIAWTLATFLRTLITKVLASTKLDDKLSAEAGMAPVSKSLGNVLYGLVLLLFLPAVLGALGLEGLLAPVRNMVDEILATLPNVFAAVAIGVVGWIVAKVLRELVTNLLAAMGVDRLGENAGLRGKTPLSRLFGIIVFVFVFIPALIAALNALQIEAISAPATEMLGTFMAAIPNLFAAGVILAVAFFVSNLLGTVLARLLGGFGFDAVPGKMGLGAIVPEGISPSQLVGKIVVFFVLLFATVEAAQVLGFSQLSGIVAMLIEFGGQVLLGVVIIAVGLWIANLAHGTICRLGRPNSNFVAGLARIAILGVVFAMGLRAMNIAETIVNVAFGAAIGAVAIAVALSFGLGGREAAGKQMEYLLARFRGESSSE